MKHNSLNYYFFGDTKRLLKVINNSIILLCKILLLKTLRNFLPKRGIITTTNSNEIKFKL